MSGSPTRPCRLVVLLSGSGSNLQAIIDYFQGSLDSQGKPAIQVAGVVSNRADAGGLARAEAAGIAQSVLRHQDYPDRDEFDQALIRLIDDYRPDWVILAGFMRIFTADFARHYQGRLLNIHPSLLPRHRGLKTHQRALEAGDLEHGATVHFVTPELDGGPALIQARIPVRPGDSPEQLAQRVLLQEHRIYPLAIRWLCEGRLQWRDGKTWFDGAPLSQPIVMPAEAGDSPVGKRSA